MRDQLKPHCTASSDKERTVWDLPTRIFHWLLPVTVTVAWLSTDAIYFETHLFSGYLLLMLLLFRLLWGFVGGTQARFRHFSYPWSAVREHLTHLQQGIPSSTIGHNPAAAWMVFLLLGVLFSITITGLLTLGAEERSGPLQGILSIESGSTLHQIHNGLAWLLIALVPLHLMGVALERWITKRKLVRAMITGNYHATSPIPVGGKIALISGLLLSTPALALWFALAEDPESPLYIPADTAKHWNRHSGFPLWQSECSECHTLHHPSLLPERSWRRLLQESDDHFEEDLSLDNSTQQTISQFLTSHAAEQALSEAAWKISSSIQTESAPLQITATPYWKEKHLNLAPSLWELPSVGSKIHCDGCHRDAATGQFHDRAVALPGE